MPHFIRFYTSDDFEMVINLHHLVRFIINDDEVQLFFSHGSYAGKRCDDSTSPTRIDSQQFTWLKKQLDALTD